MLTFFFKSFCDATDHEINLGPDHSAIQRTFCLSTFAQCSNLFWCLEEAPFLDDVSSRSMSYLEEGNLLGPSNRANLVGDPKPG